MRSLQDWGISFTCYTAALAVYLSRSSDRWWRPLVAGGATLRLTRAGDGLFRFDHSPAPLCRHLGLSVRSADAWSVAEAGIEGELKRNGRVIVLGDTWNLPWVPGNGQVHAPHWFTMYDDNGRRVISDPLELAGVHGAQRPTLHHPNDTELAELCRALVSRDPVHRLRELSVLGVCDPKLGQRFRWLEAEGDRGMTETLNEARPEPLTDLAPLRDVLRLHGDQARAYRQIDDLWQACRQRALVVSALRVETTLGEIGGVVDVDAWSQVESLWSTLPPLLLHARMLAEAGLPVRLVPDIVLRLQEIATAEAELADRRFPAAPLEHELAPAKRVTA